MNNISALEILAKLGVQFVPFLFALCVHEFAHGWVAKKRGDNTAEMMGRLTLNPFAHADLLGTFILPIVGLLAGVGGLNGGGGFIFGWAKPVPVNSRNFKNVRDDMFWVALAGPLSNLILAAISIALYILFGAFVSSPDLAGSMQTMAANFVTINMLLCVFNMIPLHPLDGGKVIARFLPRSWNYFLEQNQNQLQMALIVFFVVGGFRFLGVPIAWLTEQMVRLISGLLLPLISH
jgi:Zn-dependent protease